MNYEKELPKPPTKEEFEKESLSIMRAFTPPIYACRKCGHAVAKGFCCGACGDTSPFEPK